MHQEMKQGTLEEFWACTRWNGICLHYLHKAGTMEVLDGNPDICAAAAGLQLMKVKQEDTQRVWWSTNTEGRGRSGSMVKKMVPTDVSLRLWSPWPTSPSWNPLRLLSLQLDLENALWEAGSWCSPRPGAAMPLDKCAPLTRACRATIETNCFRQELAECENECTRTPASHDGGRYSRHRSGEGTRKGSFVLIDRSNLHQRWKENPFILSHHKMNFQGA